MLIALPPSEGKTAPKAGPPLDLDSLVLPELTEIRNQVAAELIEVSRQADALDQLKVPLGSAGEVADHLDLWDLPCAPAHEVYTGVLYQAADFGSMPKAALDRAKNSVLIFSALFGVTSPMDMICRYRLTMKSMLHTATAKSMWKDHWHHLNGIEDDLVMDGRSGEYAGWKPDAKYHVKVGAVRESGNERKVITHNAKHYRGLITRAALMADSVPSTPEDLADIGAGMGLDIELGKSGKVHTLTIVDRV